MNEVKVWSVLFWIFVAGVGVSFAGGLYQARQDSLVKQEAIEALPTIPLPQ